MTRPQGLLFDFGGTLFSTNGFDLEAARRRMFDLAADTRGFSREEVDGYADWLDEQGALYREQSPFEYPIRAFQKALYGHFGITFALTSDQMEQAFWDAALDYRPEPGLRELLDVADGLDLPMGIVSNTGFTGSVLSSVLDRYGLTERFRFLLSTADYGFRKPNPVIFLIAARRLGKRPADLWYVGDMPRFDVAGAHAAGMSGVWYNPKGEAPQPGMEADAEVGSWAELGELLAASG